MGEKQTKAILTLFFPGEYRFKDAKDKDKLVPYKMDFMKDERKKRGKEQIPLLVKIDSRRKIDEIKEKYPECECDWFGAESVFKSCGIEQLDTSKFGYQTFYPPYCVSVVNENDFDNRDCAKMYLRKMYCEYQANSPELSINNISPVDLPIWHIYNKPIAWIQTNEVQKVDVIECGNGGIAVISPLFRLEETSNITTVEYVILLCMVLLSYSSQAIWKMKRELSLSSKEPIKGIDLQKIHDSCALFDNLYYHPNPCRSDLEFELFKEMKCHLKLEQVHKQIMNAKELLDYRNELNLSTKSASIGNTVFITGYIGVLFALLSFCNIYGTDIVDLSKPVTSGWCYLFLAGLICATFCFLVKIFLIIRTCKSIRKCHLIIGIILVIIVCAICFVLFADSYGVFKIAGQ